MPNPLRAAACAAPAILAPAALAPAVFARAVLAAALAAVAAPTAALAQAPERCYGVALAGRDDGVGEAESPGSSVVDFQGDAWTWTPAESCLTLPLPAQPDGTPRRGAYQPLDRDLP
jgi:uncharacterized membrane protein